MKELETTTNADIDKLESLEHYLLGIRIINEDVKLLFVKELFCLYKIQKDIQMKSRKLKDKALWIEELILNKIKKYEDKCK